MSPNMVRRIAFAAVAIPAAVAAVWLGGWILAGLVAVVAVLGTRELYVIAEHKGVRPLQTWGLVTCALVPLAAEWAWRSPWLYGTVAAMWPGILSVWVVGLLSWTLWRRAPTERPLESAAVTMLGAGYSGALPAFLLHLRHLGAGAAPGPWGATWLVFFPLVITWICDSAAMLGGQRIGGPKLAPTVSPGKTRSGAVSGVIGALVAALLFNRLALQPTGVGMTTGQALLIGGILSVVGQVGDLAESLFKREAGLKDSSHLIPGHGGVLDRFDSLYFVIPTAAVLYHLVLGL
jgi:phosphatidate cytidylyltransferase